MKRRGGSTKDVVASMAAPACAWIISGKARIARASVVSRVVSGWVVTGGRRPTFGY